MNILLSWHGSSSHALAEILRDWLPTVLPYARPWLSSEGYGVPDDLSLHRRGTCLPGGPWAGVAHG